MFWKKEYEPTVVGCKLSDEELQGFLKENNIGYEIVDNSTHWCAYAQYYARQKGFDVVHATSFSYMVSLFLAGMGVSAGTEIYLKEEEIELVLLDKLNEIKAQPISEEEQVKEMFNTIFDFYSTSVGEYEYATERLAVRLSPQEKERFLQVPGGTNREKLEFLLEGNGNSFDDEIPLLEKGATERLDFLLTLSELRKFKEASGGTYREKLLVLLEVASQLI